MKTKCQEAALLKLTKFINSDDPFFLLTGAAGTGKTWILESFCATLTKKIRGTAPTHKAVDVLSKRLPSIQCMTIHSLLALKPKRVKMEFLLHQRLKKYRENVQGVELVIVDESSMLDDSLIDFIFKDINSTSIRQYIFVADICQLPPVGMEVSPIFEECEGASFEMVTPVRQSKESIILRNANKLRDFILFNKDYVFEYGEGFEQLGDLEFINKIKSTDLESYESQILTWTNESVLTYNKFCNKIIGVRAPDNDEDVVPPFKIGQTVVFSSPAIDGEDVIVNTGHTCKIKDMHLRVDRATGIKVYTVDIDTHAQEFQVLPSSSVDEFNEILGAARDEAIENPKFWIKFYTLNDRFSDIRPMFSSTVHKAQGATITGSVFVDVMNIMKNYDKIAAARMLYTAITRATETVICRGHIN